MVKLSRSATATFTAVMDAVLPAGPGPGTLASASASELGLPERIPELWSLLPNDRARSDLRRLLRLLGSRAGGFLLYGKPTRFQALSPGEAESALRRMATSRLGPARQGFQALKKLTSFLAFTAPPGSEASPTWGDIGYPGPIGPPPETERTIATLPVTEDMALDADVVVVGSGAGGGTAAAVLAQAGLNVVVLEKGRYVNESGFDHHEATAYRDLYLDNGFATTTDGAIALLAGSNLGGGTTINWTTSFPTPMRVREEWDGISGLESVFTGPEFEASTAAVMERLAVSKEYSVPSSTDAVMEKAMRSLGWHVDAQPRNVIGCDPEQCGFCGMGCRLGAKQGTLRTYLEDAHRDGARVVVRAKVERVMIEDDRAVGVEATVTGHQLVVRAPAVVVAGGALATPVILNRSDVSSPALGRHLHLHPATVVWGRFEEPVDPWTGMLQALHSDEFADLDGNGYGFKFETGPVHPALLGLAIGWDGGRSFKEIFLEYRYWSPIGILLRDRSTGKVGVRRDGTPAWHYKLSRLDIKHVKTGVRRAAEAVAEAGAVEVLSSTAVPVRWPPRTSQGLDGFMAGVDAAGFGANQMTYLSFHQMSSARMGRDPSKSVVDGENRVHGMEGLYVMDASCFPTASGVNPMITIQAIAHRGASRLAERIA